MKSIMKSCVPLKIAGTISTFIAIIHIIAMFIGAKAYYFMDAPYLGDLALNGSSYPIFITSIVTIFFSIFAAYAYSGASLIPKLPFLKPILLTIGIIYLLRGLLTFVFFFLYLQNGSLTILKEIGFSSIAFIAGIFYLYGTNKLYHLT